MVTIKDILRYICLLFILINSTSVGFLISRRYTERLKELTILSNLINILQNKIKFTRKTLTEIFEEISKINNTSKVSQIFLKASQKLKKEKCENAWKEAIQEERFYLNFTNEDITLISNLGAVLGKTDVEGQISEINQFRTLLDAKIKEAKQEEIKNSKLYKSLGCIIGLTISILLF